MKTRIIIAISCFVVFAILVVSGIYQAIHVTDLMNDFGKNTKLGSSGGGYPTFNGVWIYFELGAISLAAGILSVIWRKRN